MKRGFTLVEMAVVLVIIGVISGFGTLKIVQGITQSRIDMENQAMLKNLSGAVVQFAASNADSVLPTLNEFKVIAEQYTNDNKTTNRYRARKPLVFSGVNTGVCATDNTSRIVKVCTNKDCSTFYEVKNIAFSIIADTAKAKTTGDIVTIPAGGGNQESFIKYITLAEMKMQTSCQDNFRIVTETLPPIDVTGKNFSTIAIGAESGVMRETDGMYYWCIVDNGSRKIFSPSGPSKPELLYTSYNTGSSGFITTDVQNSVDNCTKSLINDHTPGRFRAYSSLITPVSSFNSGLVGGNYPITVVAKDRNNNITTKELVLTISSEQVHKLDMNNNPDKSVAEYGCFSLKKNDNTSVTVCNQTPTAATKRYCIMTGFISGTTIGNATDCKDKIEDLLK